MLPLKEAHRRFIEHLKQKNHSHSTLLAYGKDIDQLIQFLEELKKYHITDVSREDLDAFIAKLEHSGYTPKSVSRKINALRTFFRFLHVHEFITDNPAVLLEHPKVELKPPRILSETEYRALRDATRSDPRAYAIVELLLQTGMRIGELARLRLEDIKFSEGATKLGEITIRPYNKNPERIVPLNKRAEQALKEYLKTRPNVKTDYVFVTRNGKPMAIRNIRTMIKRYMDLVGIEDATVNDLRHTFIAHHLKRGASLVLISKIAGHRSLLTTERYLQYLKSLPPKERLEISEL